MNIRLVKKGNNVKGVDEYVEKGYSKKVTVKRVCVVLMGVALAVTTAQAAKKTGLNKATVKLAVGKSTTLKMKGTKSKVKWSTSNKKIATVDNKGKVTAKKAGSCKIVATVQSKKYICKVKVIAKKTENTPVAEKITVKELTVQKGEKKIYGKLYSPIKEGKHPAVILSHGYNGVHSDFATECTYFAENGYVAYAYDFCGGSTRSKSSGKSTDMTVFTEKEDLLDVFEHIRELENVDSEQMFLFGGSQGGFVTSLVAEELMEKVQGMILYFPALNIPDDWRRNYTTVEAIPETVDFWGLKLGKNFFLSIRDFYTFDNIGAYPNDVLIIYGEKDAIVPYNTMLEAEKVYNNAKLVVLKNEGHGFTVEGGKKAQEMVLDFMKKH